MNYRIVNKTTRKTPSAGKQVLTEAELISTIDGFIAFNPSAKELPTNQDKIDYYTANSYYDIVLVRFQYFEYNGKDYSLDLNNWQMTVTDSGEEYGIGSAKLVAEVITNGTQASN